MDASICQTLTNGCRERGNAVVVVHRLGYSCTETEHVLSHRSRESRHTEWRFVHGLSQCEMESGCDRIVVIGCSKNISQKDGIIIFFPLRLKTPCLSLFINSISGNISYHDNVFHCGFNPRSVPGLVETADQSVLAYRHESLSSIPHEYDYLTVADFLPSHTLIRRKYQLLFSRHYLPHSSGFRSAHRMSACSECTKCSCVNIKRSLNSFNGVLFSGLDHYHRGNGKRSQHSCTGDDSLLKVFEQQRVMTTTMKRASSSTAHNRNSSILEGSKAMHSKNQRDNNKQPFNCSCLKSQLPSITDKSHQPSKPIFSSPSSLSSSSLSSSSSSSSSSISSSSSSSSTLGVFLLFLLICLSNPRATTARDGQKDISIHALIPKQFFIMEELSREYSNVVLNFFRDSRHMNLRYGPFSVLETVTFLQHDKPTEILDTFCKNVLNSKTAAIININNPLGIRRRSSSSRYILNLAQYWGMPTISWDTEFSGTPQAKYEYRTLQLAPTVNHQVRAMVNFLERYNWTHFSIITSRVAGDMEFVSTLETAVENSKNLTPSTDGVKRKRLEILSTTHIEDPKKSKEKLSRFVGSDTRVFLLHCSSLASYDIIGAAASLKLTGQEYVWVLTRSCIPHAKYAPRKFPVGLLGLSFDYGKEAMKDALRVGVKIWLKALLDMINDVPDISSMDIPPKLACQSQDKQFWKYGRLLYEYMLNVTLHDEPNIVFNRNGTLRDTEISIINLQWYDGKRLKKQWKEVGRWKRYGLKMKDITWPGESPMAPTGKPKRAFLRVVTLYETPYVVYRNLTANGGCDENALPCQIYARDENKNIIRNGTVKKCCVGLSIDLLRILKVELNFDAELKEVNDGQWGGTDANGNWNGLVKALMDDECDMVVTSLKINPDRAGAVEFSVPYLETGIKIIVALRDGAISPTAFLEPYDYASWSLILIFSVHATGSSILIFEWLSPKGLNRGLTPIREHKFSLFRSFWLIWAMLFSTSVQTDSPRGIASRFLANIWALFALVFLASYTANLAAFMITKEEYYDLSGIKDYRLQNPYVMNPPFKYATTAYGSTEAMLKSNHENMYKYMKKLNLPDVEAGIKALKAGDIHAFIYDSSVLEYIASRDPNCRLVTVGNRYAETGYGIGFPPDPDNPWIAKVNKVILRLQENGEMDRLQKFWLAGACDSKKEAGISNRTLGILNFTSAFILLGSGILLGLMLLVMEHLYFKFGRKHLRKIDKCGCCALVSLSMGRSLRLKDTVDQAMNLVNKNRCRDQTRESHTWKLKHRTDMPRSISEVEMEGSLPTPLTMESSLHNNSPLPNHRPDPGVCQQQPQSLNPHWQYNHQQHQQQPQPQLQQQQQQPQLQQPQTSYSLPNNVDNHDAYKRRTTPTASLPYPRHSPSMFEVHSIPEVSYSKDLNGDSCHIRSTSPDDFMSNPDKSLEEKLEIGAIPGNKYVELPPSYSDCSNGYFPFDDGRYAPFNALDDNVDSECGSTHSTTTTSLGAAVTGKISPWPGLKRSPSYTSAVGGSFSSDIDKSPNVNRSRKFDGKTYVGVSGLGV